MRAYCTLGDLGKAIQDAERAAQMKATTEDYDWLCRAEANRFIGNYQRALRDFAEGRRRRPWASDDWNEEAYLLASCPEAALRDGKRAVGEATRACELTHWQQAASIDTLAAAEAEEGNFAVAIKREEQALPLITTPHQRAEYEKHLELFKHHHPVRLVPKSLYGQAGTAMLLLARV